MQYVSGTEFQHAKKETRFGKLVAGTDYENYAIDNKFIDESKMFIEHKTGSSKFSFSFIFKGQKFGIWIDYNIGKMYVSNDYIDNGLCFATTTEDHQPNTMLYSIAKNIIVGIVLFKIINLETSILKI